MTSCFVQTRDYSRMERAILRAELPDFQNDKWLRFGESPIAWNEPLRILFRENAAVQVA